MSSLPKYKSVTRTQVANAALKDGRVQPKGFVFDWVEVDPLIAAFRRMVRNSEFDVCEMALSTYLCAREHGKRFTALPVFLVRAFHHSAILVRRDNSARSPKALEGQRVGVAGGYTTTTGLWARALLQELLGDKIYVDGITAYTPEDVVLLVVGNGERLLDEMISKTSTKEGWVCEQRAW